MQTLKQPGKDWREWNELEKKLEVKTHRRHTPWKCLW